MNVVAEIDRFFAEPLPELEQHGDLTLSTRLDRIAFLFGKNAFSMVVHGWGPIEVRPEQPGGEIGLTVHEALQLIYTEGILTGFVRASDNDPCVAEHFFNRIDETLRRFCQERGIPVGWKNLPDPLEPT